MSKLRELLGKDVQSTSESEWDRMLAHAVLDSYLMRNAEAIATLLEAAENECNASCMTEAEWNRKQQLRAALAAIEK
jgi:hypothetical protein